MIGTLQQAFDDMEHGVYDFTKDGKCSGCGKPSVYVDDLAGKKFWNMTVIRYAGINQKGRSVWLCKCDCGNEVSVLSNSLRNGAVVSCGCYRKERLHEKTFKNLSGGRYGRWLVLEEFKMENEKTYWLFQCDCGTRKYVRADHLSIDHINVNGNYEPSNCRWVDSKTQANNRRNNHYVKINGIVHTLKQWSEISCVPYGTICQRIRNGWNEEAAIFTVVGSVKKYEA